MLNEELVQDEAPWHRALAGVKCVPAFYTHCCLCDAAT
jgi:hypothetical protein